MRVVTPAKLNLHLRVGHPRGDGFHPLASWMVTVGLFDNLTFSRFTTGSRDTQASRDPQQRPPCSGSTEGALASSSFTSNVVLTCDDATLPLDSRNLVRRAADALFQRAGRSDPISIRLEKRIPAAGGLGGGSSDAAATLVSLDRLLDTRLGEAALNDLAASLGSDVNFFLKPPSAWCTGRGEIVTPLPIVEGFALLILPSVPMPTAAVYRRFDEMLGSSVGRAFRPASGLDGGPEGPPYQNDRGTPPSIDNLLPRLVNDLEPAAFSLEPALGKLRSLAEATIARPVRMSGSGSTLYSLFADEASARSGAAAIDAEIGSSQHVFPSVRTLVCNLCPTALV